MSTVHNNLIFRNARTVVFLRTEEKCVLIFRIQAAVLGPLREKKSEMSRIKSDIYELVKLKYHENKFIVLGHKSF